MNNFIIYNGELYHHGVKGMKWGVRKARANNSVSTGKRRASKSTNDKSLSDAERSRKFKRNVIIDRTPKIVKSINEYITNMKMRKMGMKWTYNDGDEFVEEMG